MKKRFTQEQHQSDQIIRDRSHDREHLPRTRYSSRGTFYNWRSRYAGLEVNEAKRLKSLESENNQLKKVVDEQVLEIRALKEVLSKKW